jgi:hypothetical protein
MRSKLLVAAVAASLGVTSVAAAAVPAQHLHHKKHAQQAAQPAASAAEIEQLKAQLAELQAKVAALETRTDAQSGINASTSQSVQQATTVAAATDKRVTALDKVVNDTTVSGKMYFDFSNISQKNSDTGHTDATGTGLDVKRFYLGVNHQFNDVWSANLTTDFNYVSADAETNLFVKKAYLQGKFSDAAIFRAGSADMPWIGFVENYYGFRYVENTLIDRLKYGNAADWGLHLGGDVGAGKNLNYAVSVVNGGGYKNPGRSKGVDVEGRVGFVPFENMIVGLGGYSGHLGRDTETTGAEHTATRGDLVVAYADTNFRLGGEYFTAKNWGNLVLSPLSDKADGYSFWGSIALADDVSLFARYDNASLSRDLDRNAKDVYYNLGVQYQVTKGLKLAGVWKHEKADKSVFTQTPVPLPAHVQNVKTNEVGVFGEVSF